MERIGGTMQFYFIVLVLTLVNLASSDLKTSSFASPHIIGGSEAKPHAYPHQVHLVVMRNGGKDATCGGSLISPLWVLTAAHCGEDVDYIFAVVGAHKIMEFELSQQMKLVDEIVKAPGWYYKTVANDIALMRLQSDVSLNDNVQTIQLPSWSQKNKWFWRYPVIITGWGMSSYDASKETPRALQVAESKVATNLYCKYRFGFGKVESFHICVDGSHGQAAYKGDSGGPLVITEPDGKYTLIGVASMGRGINDDQSFPTLYTRVTNYLQWISDTSGVPIRE